MQVLQSQAVDWITNTTSLRQWHAPHLAEDGVGAEGTLLDAAVRGRRRAVAEHLVLRRLLLVLRRLRLAVLPEPARVVAGVRGRGAAEAEGRGSLAPVGPIGGRGGHGLGRGHGRKLVEGSVWGFGVRERDLGFGTAAAAVGRRRRRGAGF